MHGRPLSFVAQRYPSTFSHPIPDSSLHCSHSRHEIRSPSPYKLLSGLNGRKRVNRFTPRAIAKPVGHRLLEIPEIIYPMMTVRFPRSPSDRNLRNLTSLRSCFNYWVNWHGFEWVVIIPNCFITPLSLPRSPGLDCRTKRLASWYPILAAT